MSDKFDKTICVAMTGASGIQYALRLIECLVQANCQVYVLMSKPARIVMGMDTDLNVPSRTAQVQSQFSEAYGAREGQLKAFGQEEWTAPVASGSGAPDAMVICPCTTGTLASVAAGTCNSLLERAADVVIKEGRKLIVMPREMPFSVIHLENMTRLARAGVVIMPPNPAFYNLPKTVDDLVDFVVARVLDQLDVKQVLMPRWGIEES
ncbi:UbiX family flavin prenyltransferase [Granulosicoccus sp.]|jgi:4-hydroxy-3-polyprenylbenzoate decarboxylase|nr:flavin prenyltransferase UbiX [Granulosicoccus sp.]MDB4222268.1 UbiX family flavin prenyltransferase [Granulosicoccus sp.]